MFAVNVKSVVPPYKSFTISLSLQTWILRSSRSSVMTVAIVEIFFPDWLVPVPDHSQKSQSPPLSVAPDPTQITMVLYLGPCMSLKRNCVISASAKGVVDLMENDTYGKHPDHPGSQDDFTDNYTSTWVCIHFRTHRCLKRKMKETILRTVQPAV